MFIRYIQFMINWNITILFHENRENKVAKVAVWCNKIGTLYNASSVYFV